MLTDWLIFLDYLEDYKFNTSFLRLITPITFNIIETHNYNYYSGYSSVYGYGDGDGDGDGYGYGYGYGDGSGDGYIYGYNNGNGCGFGNNYSNSHDEEH